MQPFKCWHVFNIYDDFLSEIFLTMFNILFYPKYNKKKMKENVVNICASVYMPSSDFTIILIAKCF